MIAEEIKQDGDNLNIPASNPLPDEVTAPSGKVYKLNYKEDGSPIYLHHDSESGKTFAIRFRIRKLTPRECYRLMDVPEQKIDQMLATRFNAKKGKDELIVARTHHYKAAGNSIVVACLAGIFDKMFIHTEVSKPKPGTQLSIFDILDDIEVNPLTQKA